MALNLYHYILESNQWDSEALELKINEYSTLKFDLQKTLISSVVVESDGYVEITKEHTNISQSFTGHIDFINDIIKYLVANRINNSLKNGYIDPSKVGTYMNEIYNPSVGFQVNIMKSPIWNCVSDILGRNNFLKMVLSCNVYCECNGSYVLLCGPVKNISFVRNEKNRLSSKDYHMFCDTYEQTILNIVNDKDHRFTDCQSLPRKYDGLQKIIKFAFVKHKTFNYKFHFRRHVTSSNPSNLDILMKLDVKKIIDFCLLVISKMFPKTVWGSAKNKATMEQLVQMTIFSGIKSIPTIDKLIDKFKCSHFTWIGSSSKMQNSQDLVSRKKILTQFLSWFFYDFLADLITKFLKKITKTEGGGRTQIDYYLRNEWKIKTGEWLSGYVRLYLYKLNDEFTKAANKETNFVGVIKLLPKKDGFRMLCMPLRSRPLSLEVEAHEENIRYSLHLKNVIRPLQRLLSFKDRLYASKHGMSHPRCYSPQDVATKINEFRSTLSKSKCAKSVYVLKFDMTKCFDNMNQEILLEMVERLFEDDEEDKYYFVRNYTLKSIVSTNKGDSRKYVIKDSDTVHELWGNETVSGLRAISDQCTTNRFNKEDVLRIVRNYVKNSAVFIEGNSLELYKRRTGVFQGFPLLATLCNIYYNQLVDKVFKNILNTEEGKMSMLLRLVDDFLYISTSDDRQKIFEIVNGEKFKSCGAILNELKTAWYPEVVVKSGDNSISKWNDFSFVGLRITNQLDVRPNNFFDPTQLSIAKSKSIDQCYSILNWWYRSQLKVHVITTNLGETIPFDNLKSLWNILMSSIVRLLDHFHKKGQTTSPQKIIYFLLSLMEMSLVIWKSVNKTEKHNKQIIHLIKSAIQSQVQYNSIVHDAYEILKRI